MNASAPPPDYLVALGRVMFSETTLAVNDAAQFNAVLAALMKGLTPASPHDGLVMQSAFYTQHGHQLLDTARDNHPGVHFQVVEVLDDPSHRVWLIFSLKDTAVVTPFRPAARLH